MPASVNEFKGPEHTEVAILKKEGGKIGTIRLKPNRVLWKKAGEGKFYSLPLDDFIAWITDPKTKARRTKS